MEMETKEQKAIKHVLKRLKDISENWDNWEHAKDMGYECGDLIDEIEEILDSKN